MDSNLLAEILCMIIFPLVVVCAYRYGYTHGWSDGVDILKVHADDIWKEERDRCKLCACCLPEKPKE